MTNLGWKDFIKLFIPPIMVRFIKIINFTDKPELLYAPTGWDTPLIKSNDTGWNSSQAVEIEQQRWEAYCKAIKGTGPIAFMHDHDNPTELHDEFHNRNITLAYVLALAAMKKETISILDYGGSLGHNYYFAKAMLPDCINIDYHCKEVPLIVKAGKKLNPHIKWYFDDSWMDNKFDLVIINAVLGYTKEWRHLLHQIISVVGEYMFLGHVLLVNYDQGFVALQRRYGIEMLHYQFNRNELLSFIDLCLVREFLTGVRPYIKNAPEQCDFRSFLYRKG